MLIPSFFKNFKFIWTFYYIIISFVFGIWIMVNDKRSFVDGFFTSTSSMSGTGLAVFSMNELSTTGFILTGILMFLGSPAFMLLPTILYRRVSFQKIHQKVIATYQSHRQANGAVPFNQKSLKVIEESYLVYESLVTLTNIIVLFYSLWMIFGILGIYLTLRSFPLEPELAERGAEYIDSAVYLAVSAFSNTGLAMTDSLIGLSNNPSCYVTISLLILAGNTGLPILLRYFIVFLRYCNQQFTQYHPEEKNRFSNSEPYKYHFNTETILSFILNHPRSLTTHLFTDLQTKLLILMVLELIAIQYIFFVFSTVFDHQLLKIYPLPILLGIGYFQTLSTRSAGFSFMDLRYFDQGLIFIYMIMMYISAFPFVTTLHNSNVRRTDDNQFISELEEEDMEQGASSVEKIVEAADDDIERRKDLNTSVPKKHQNKNQNTIQNFFSANQEFYRTVVRQISFDFDEDKHSSIELSEKRRKSVDSATLKQSKQNINQMTFTPLLSLHQPQEDSMNNQEQKNNNNITANEPPLKIINQQFTKHFLFRHTFFLVLIVLILSYSEDTLIHTTEYDVNLWYIIFEIVSAYGSVGLSLGIPGKGYSLSGQMSDLGKFCIIFVMFLGKHRGLPNKNDEVIDFNFESFQIAYQQTE